MPASKKPVLASSVVAELKALNEEVQQADNAVKNCADPSEISRLQFLYHEADLRLKGKLHDATISLADQCKGVIPLSVRDKYGVEATVEASCDMKDSASAALDAAHRMWLDPHMLPVPSGGRAGGVNDAEDGKLVVYR
jgi:hypothetical protein